MTQWGDWCSGTSHLKSTIMRAGVYYLDACDPYVQHRIKGMLFLAPSSCCYVIIILSISDTKQVSNFTKTPPHTHTPSRQIRFCNKNFGEQRLLVQQFKLLPKNNKEEKKQPLQLEFRHRMWTRPTSTILPSLHSAQPVVLNQSCGHGWTRGSHTLVNQPGLLSDVYVLLYA